MEKILEVKNLNKKYDEKKAVDDMNFDVKGGDIIGFLGPNGAGKSTTIRMIMGIESSDSGEISYLGKNIQTYMKQFQKSIGVVPQDIAVYNDLSAYDNVKFFCSLYGFHKSELEKRVKDALEFVGLWDRRKDRPGKFSGGMKRRLNIACAIAHSPKLLIMDEPTVGIDPQSRNNIIETIKILNSRNTTVIYVSHYMEEIEALCNRVVIADKGHVIEDMDKEELKEKYKSQGKNNLEDIFLHITGEQLRDEEA